MILISACSSPSCGPQGASSQPAASIEQPVARVINPFEGITVIRDSNASTTVLVDAWTCLDDGWLEQVACAPSSREHESLVVVKPEPSQIHAALLMAGFEPGLPGNWTYDNDSYSFIKPTGEELDISVRYRDAAGKEREHSVHKWIREASGRNTFPDDPWVFGGSQIRPNLQWMGPGEHYVADMTGSVIGLVTFGDEVIGFSRVWSDQVSIQPPEWEVDSDAMPPIDTPVKLIITKYNK